MAFDTSQLSNCSIDTDSGEFRKERQVHREETEAFCRGLAAADQKVPVEMEASGHGRWFERLRSELQLEVWIGDAAEIQAMRIYVTSARFTFR